jgi:hypothetical protein
MYLKTYVGGNGSDILKAILHRLQPSRDTLERTLWISFHSQVISCGKIWK